MSRTVEQRLAEVEQALAELVLRGNDPPDSPSHSSWTCSGCQSLLGWFDPSDGIMRRKVGADVTYFTLGVGGKVTVVCARCAAVNVVTYDDCETMRQAAKEAATKAG